MNNFRAERMVVSTSVHFKKYWSYSAVFLVLLSLLSCSSGQFCNWKLYVILKYSKTSTFKGNINRTMHSLTFGRKILECYWFFFCTFQSGCLLRNYNIHAVHARSTRARQNKHGPAEFRVTSNSTLNSNHFLFTYFFFKISNLSDI